MSSTANLNIDYLVDSQAQKTVTVNEALDALDGVLGNLLAITMTDANYTMASADALGNLVFVFTGALTANRNIVVPTNKKLYIVRNSTTGSHSIVVKTSGGTGITLAVSATTYALLYCDGTNVVQVGSASGGTVTSVAATVPSFLTVSGSPITTSGTIAITATTGQTANSVLATPDGSSGALSIRLLVAADIPNLSAAKITTGTLALARGGTGVDLSASGSSTAILAQDASHVISARSLIAADIPNLAASIITSGTLALARGGTNADLSASGGATFILAQDASHVVSARALVAADIPSLAASIIASGTLALARGGTNADLSASGSATAVLAQDGSHVISARSLIAADIPSLDASKIASGLLDQARGGAPNLNTSGRGYFMFPMGRVGYDLVSSGLTGAQTANATRAMQFVLDETLVIGKASINVTTTSNGNHYYAGIYDEAGTTLIGQITWTAGAGTGVLTASGLSITLKPGTYWMLWGEDAAIVVSAPGNVAATLVGLFNANVVRLGNSNATISSGVMPANIGTVTGGTTNPPYIMLEP